MAIDGQLVEGVRAQATEADALHRRARDLLLDAVHRASSAGLSQREIAQLVRRSQPEVSRLLRQKPPGPLALRIWDERQRMSTVLAKYGIVDAQVFGSVATRSEHDGSDLDLLVDAPGVLSLGALSRLEHDLSEMLHATVDVVPVRSLPDHARERALAEAVPL